jgi:copper chaperone CopZ
VIELGITDKAAGGGCMCGAHDGTTHTGHNSDAACACGGHGDASHGHHAPGTLPAAATATAATATVSAAPDVYLVEGMTCSHCVSSVTEEVGALPGVESVTVELVPGGLSRVSIATSSPVSDSDVHAAVEEAGYSLSA